MIALANRKASVAGADVELQTAVVEALPFADASFDVVLSSLMLHHLPRAVREDCAREMRRVLKPGGRILVVDFATPARERKGLLAHLHRNGHVRPTDIVAVLSNAGLRIVDKGSVGVSDLHFVVATEPGIGDDDVRLAGADEYRSLDSLPMPRWIFLVAVVAVVAGHAAFIGSASSLVTLSALAVAGLVLLLIIAHAGGVGIIRKFLQRPK